MEAKALQEYDIKFVGLAEGEHHYEYTLTEEFFKKLDYSEIDATRLVAKVTLNKKLNGLELSANIDGYTRLRCDITDTPFEYPLRLQNELLVKFGDEFDNSDDEIWVIPDGEHKLNIAQFLYEMIVVSIPMKKIHPKVQSGEMGAEALERLKNYSPENNKEEKKEEIDPRWNKLRDLLD